MSFFDKKEEVVEVQLTQYGKHLLSRGKFAPKLYAFFDDDIIYDSLYGDIEEEQGEAQERIEGELPRLKTQYVFSSREKEVKKLTAALVSGKVDLQDRIIQPTADKHYALSAPLGNSELGKNKAPAWHINFLRGRAQERVDFMTGAMPTLKIPQLKMFPITYKTRVWSDTPPDNSFTGLAQVGDAYGPGSQGDLSVTLTQYDDGSYVSIEEDYAIVDVREANTEFRNDNFDIEVFLVEEVDEQDNIVPKHMLGEIESREKLYPLSFIQNKTYIKNGFLLDEPEGGPVDENPVIDPSYVEYWFNIWVDDEIDERVLENVSYNSESSKNIYMDNDGMKNNINTEPSKEQILYGSAGKNYTSGPITDANVRNNGAGGIIYEDDGDC